MVKATDFKFARASEIKFKLFSPK